MFDLTTEVTIEGVGLEMIDPARELIIDTEAQWHIINCAEKIDAVCCASVTTDEPGIASAGRDSDILPGGSGMIPECVGGSVVNKEALFCDAMCS